MVDFLNSLKKQYLSNKNECNINLIVKLMAKNDITQEQLRIIASDPKLPEQAAQLTTLFASNTRDSLEEAKGLIAKMGYNKALVANLLSAMFTKSKID